MRTAYLKKTALASEPHTLIEEIAKLEAQIKHVQGRVRWLGTQTKTLPQRIERTLRTLEALALADVNSHTSSGKAKADAMEQRAALEEALEMYQKDLEVQQGDLETLQKALDEKRAKLSQFVAIQVGG